MRLLIAGWQSQVAKALMARAARDPKVDACALCRPGLELAALPTVQRQFKDQRPDVIVNASAYRDVHGAEQDRAAAMALNRDGAARLTAAANDVGAAVIHISSYRVFAGTGDTPWQPGDPTDPVSFYGESRVAGEEAVRAASDNHVILRTGWLLNGTGATFVGKVREAIAGGLSFQAVDDHHGTPSFADETARAIL
ncbi:MAG: sugar nucleotide-binding protein [Pseudomonadota bacterium]